MDRAALVIVVCSGCGSSTPPPAPPVAVVADAAIADTPPSDAGVPAEVLNAPAWIFRYNAPGRIETWTLRYSNSNALVMVERASGTTRYIGTVHDLTLSLAAGPNLLSLECKPAKLPVGATCGDKKPKSQDVLDCFHPDFKAPMTFGAAPGVEYVVTDACSGYVRVAP